MNAPREGQQLLESHGGTMSAVLDPSERQPLPPVNRPKAMTTMAAAWTISPQALRVMTMPRVIAPTRNKQSAAQKSTAAWTRNRSVISAW